MLHLHRTGNGKSQFKERKRNRPVRVMQQAAAAQLSQHQGQGSAYKMMGQYEGVLRSAADHEQVESNVYHDNRLHDSGHQKLSEDFISMDEVPQQPICEESHSDVADRDENSK